MRIRSGPEAMALLVTVIAVLAFGLRVVGLQFGLPAVYNPDEVAIMARALSFAKGTLNPHNFLYPTFYFYVLFGWVGIYLSFVWITGGVQSVAALQELYFSAPTGIYTAGRMLSVVCGTAATVVVWRIGERLFDRGAGLLAALFLAVSPLAVRDAHYVKHDVPATLAVLLAFLFITRLWQQEAPNRRAMILASAATGLAFSTHYYCIFLAVPLAVAIVLATRSFGAAAVARRLAAAAGISAAVFFLLSPFILAEPQVALRDIVANRRIVVDRALESGTFASASRYADILLNDSVGLPVLGLGVAGSVWLLVRMPQTALLLLAFPASFLVFIVNTAPGSRYLNPVVPFVTLLAGWCLVRAGRRFGASKIAVAAVAVACAVPPFLASVRGDRFFRQEDTRTLALRYIEQNVASGATILVQPYSVPLTPSRDSLIEALQRHVGSVAAASTKYQIQLRLNPYPDPAYRLVWLGRGGLDVDKIYITPEELSVDPIATLRRAGVEIVVLKTSDVSDPLIAAFADALDRSSERLAEFSPYKGDTGEPLRTSVEPFLHNADTRIDSALERPGPVLRIWRLPR